MTAIPAPHPALPGYTALQAGASTPLSPDTDPATGTATAAVPPDDAFSAVMHDVAATDKLADSAVGAGTDTISLAVQGPISGPVQALFALADGTRPGTEPPSTPPPDGHAAGKTLPVDGESMPSDDLDTLLTTLGSTQSDPTANQVVAVPGTADQPQPLPLIGPIPIPSATPDSANAAGELTTANGAEPGLLTPATGVAGPAIQESPTITTWHQKAALTNQSNQADLATIQDALDPTQVPSSRNSTVIDQALPAEFRTRLEAMMAPAEHNVSSIDAGVNPLVASYAGGTDATAANTSAAPSGHQLFVDLPVLEPQADQQAWTRGLGERLLLMAEKGQQSATLRLQPEQLGPLQIHIRVDEDGASQILFSAHHAQTREAIEQAMPRLRELFAEQGLNLGQADVDSGRGAFKGRDFTAPENAWPQDAGTETETGELQNATLWQLHPASRRRLDVFA